MGTKLRHRHFSFLFLLILFFITWLRLNAYSNVYYNSKWIDNIHQLTFNGSNSEPALSADGRFIIFQGSGSCYGTNCEQIYRIDSKNPSKWPYRLSTGFGDTHTAIFSSNDDYADIIYSGTFHYESLNFNENLSSKQCPHICKSKRAMLDKKLHDICTTSNKLYELKDKFDIFRINAWGNFRSQLTNESGYDAEASISPDGKWIVYTSMSSGDPDLWLMNAIDGSQKKRLTTWTGYEGGANFSPDGNYIIFHATCPTPGDEMKRYRTLLQYNLIELHNLQIKVLSLKELTTKAILNNIPKYFIESAKNSIKLNRNFSAWKPIFLPDGRHIIFSSNLRGNRPDHYHLFSIDLNIPSKLHQLTYHTNAFDAFPTVDSSGKKLVWASTLGAQQANEINLFSADLKLSFVIKMKEEKDIKKTKIQRNLNDKLQQIHYPGEDHLNNIRQITFGGQNAEGYFSFDGESIVLQATGYARYGTSCDQIYRADFLPDFPDKNTIFQRLSTGLGTCTCAYFFPDDKTSIHAATFASLNFSNPEINVVNTCPPKRCTTPQAKTDPILRHLCNTSYTWDLFPTYDIYKVNQFGNIIKRLTDVPGYDAEGAISPDGRHIVFTSMRSGDPELWLMDANGDNLRQLTSELGYDGGPFFSPDGTKVIFRASRPKTTDEIEHYKQLLSYDLVEPLAMELYTISLEEGSKPRKVTTLGNSNWAPFYLADNFHIIFSSNFNATGFFGTFDLYVIGEDGSGLQRVTFNEGGFDAFPMQSRDARRLIWGSSRNGQGPMDLNLFLADWVNNTVSENSIIIT